eukprot:m51a1_g10711 hypothetical protein (217) ;mRNA; f:188635-189285
MYAPYGSPRKSQRCFYAGVSVLAALLVLSGLVAGAGVVLEVLWETTANARLEPPTPLRQTVDAAVGPDDCLPVLVRATGLVGVDLTSTDLEFSVASQASPQCAEGSSRATRDISAVSLRRGLVLGSRSELLEGDYVVVRAVQDEDGGNATTRVHGVVTVSPTGELLWRSFFLYVAKSGLVALGALLAVVCCALLFLVIRRRIAGDDEQGQPLLTRP